MQQWGDYKENTKQQQVTQNMKHYFNPKLDFHQVRPEYLRKLKRIDEGRFISRADFEKELE